MCRALGHLDNFLHWSLDGYINRQHVGWGLVQLGQWHVCNAYENWHDRAHREPTTH